MNKKKTPAAATAEALNKDTSQNPYRASPNKNQSIPSRATLARRFPKLRVNRLNWRWIDDASGAKGDDFASLLAFLRGAGR